MTELEALREKLAEYEKRMGIGENDPAKDGYLVLVEILRQQNTYLSTFKIKEKIGSDEKGTVTEYKNAKDLWENLPKMIGSVNDLKAILKMEGNIKQNTSGPITPQSIAKTKHVP